MRSRPGSRPTSAENGRVGGGAGYGSPCIGPEVASSSAALSRTVRVSACSTAHPLDRVAVLGSERIASAGRLEAEQSARRRRIADRSAQVVAVRARHHPGRHGRRRSAARPARRARHVPRVARRPEQQGFDGRHHAELRCVGLADDDEPRSLESYHELRGETRDVVAQEPRTFGEAHAFDLDHEVLEEVRHTGQGPGLLDCGRPRRPFVCLRQCPLEHRCHDRVQGRVEVLDPLDRPLDEIASGHLALPDELGLAHRVELADLPGVVAAHGLTPPRIALRP